MSQNPDIQLKEKSINPTINNVYYEENNDNDNNDDDEPDFIEPLRREISTIYYHHNINTNKT